MGRKEPHHYSKRVGVVDPGGVTNLYGLWDWVGIAPRIGPESRSCTFLWAGLCPEKLVNRAGKQINQVYYETNPPNTASGGASSQGWTWSWNRHVISY